jgi:hypothetical protein
VKADEADLPVLQNLKIGDFLDVQDSVPRWCMAELVNQAGNNFQVHYSGWPSRYDEWIELRSGRLAPFVLLFLVPLFSL